MNKCITALLCFFSFFLMGSLPAGQNSGTIETYVVTVENYNGVNYQASWYSDGSVLTVLDGKDGGKQFVIHDNKVVDTSTNYTVYGDHFIHFYQWGCVTSYSNRQILKIN